METTAVQERVRKGALAIDRIQPRAYWGGEDWYDVVDPQVLDLNHNRLCIIGQAWGNYYDNAISVARAIESDMVPVSGYVAAWTGTEVIMREHGMLAMAICRYSDDHERQAAYDAEITEMKEAWRQEIYARRANRV
jgi:hypothetical protein